MYGTMKVPTIRDTAQMSIKEKIPDGLAGAVIQLARFVYTSCFPTKKTSRPEMDINTTVIEKTDSIAVISLEFLPGSTTVDIIEIAAKNTKIQLAEHSDINRNNNGIHMTVKKKLNLGREKPFTDTLAKHIQVKSRRIQEYPEELCIAVLKNKDTEKITLTIKTEQSWFPQHVPVYMDD